jgi:hypothetical protein
LEINEEEYHKSPEENEVVYPELFTHNTELDESIEDHAFEARPEKVKPVFPPPQTEHRKIPVYVSQKETCCKQKNDNK